MKNPGFLNRKNGIICVIFSIFYFLLGLAISVKHIREESVIKGLDTILAFGIIYIFLRYIAIILHKNQALQQERKALFATIDQMKRMNLRHLECQKIAHVGIWEYDISKGLYYFSEESKELLGLPHQEEGYQQEYIEQYIYPEYHEKKRQALLDLIKHGKPLDLEVWIRSPKNVKPMVIHFKAKMQQDDVTGENRLVGVFQDVTAMRLTEEALRKNQEQFTSILNQSPFGISLQDISSGCIYYVNQKFREMFKGYGEALASEDWAQFIYEEDYPAFLEKLESILSGLDKQLDMKLRIVAQSGACIWINLKIGEIQVENKPMLLYMVEDISEQVRMEELIEENKRSRTVLLSNLPGMAYRCKFDENWTMEFVSGGCKELTGYRPEQIINNAEISFQELISPEFREFLFKKWAIYLEQKKKCQVEYILNTADGEKKWVWEQGAGIYNKEGNLVAIEGLILDITERKLREEKIKYLNYHDVLTGINNRRFFEKQKVLLDRSEYLPISVIVGDINGLKIINDALGHDQGDKLISDTAKLIKSCLRAKDVMARTGGDEFHIILPNTDLQETEVIIGKIREKCRFYNQNLNQDLYQINISLGYDCKYHGEDSLNRVIKRAEDHMYRHKLLEHKSFHSSLIESMKRTMYERSEDTKDHAERLVDVSKRLGKRLGLSPEELDQLELFATLHDIGKIIISSTVLEKPGILDENDWEEMRKHPEAGYRIAMASPELASVAEYILTHHEKWDGTGYPQGLKGETIPRLSRILSIVDAYDAMTEDRVYRKAMSKEKAIEELRYNMGKQFDPLFTKVFITMLLEEDYYSELEA